MSQPVRLALCLFGRQVVVAAIHGGVASLAKYRSMNVEAFVIRPATVAQLVAVRERQQVAVRVRLHAAETVRGVLGALAEGHGVRCSAGVTSSVPPLC